MKINILQQDLLAPLSSVARSCGIRTTLPVLANILLSTDSGKLKLSATNLELGVVKLVNCQVITEGEITVPSKTLLEIVSALIPGQIELELIGEQLKITTDKFSAALNTIPASEFPVIPISSDTSVNLDAAILEQSLPQISFAAAVDEGRPILTGILTEVKKDTLELVATDGFRLAHWSTKLSGDGVIKALIPRRSLEEVVRLISEEEEVDKVAISTSDNQNQMVFRINQTILSTRLIEGNFPSWEKVIPAKSVNRTIIDRGEFLKAAKLASVFARDSANLIRLKTSPTKLMLSSSTKELGQQETEVEAKSEGEDISIAFNSKFLTEALSACPSSQIVIEFSGNLAPALIKPMGTEGLEYVIMPVRES